MKWIYSVTCPFRSEIPLLKTTVCVMGVITSSQSSYFLLKEKKKLFFIHIGVLIIFHGCLKFLP